MTVVALGDDGNAQHECFASFARAQQLNTGAMMRTTSGDGNDIQHESLVGGGIPSAAEVAMPPAAVSAVTLHLAMSGFEAELDTILADARVRLISAAGRHGLRFAEPVSVRDATFRASAVAQSVACKHLAEGSHDESSQGETSGGILSPRGRAGGRSPRSGLGDAATPEHRARCIADPFASEGFGSPALHTAAYASRLPVRRLMDGSIRETTKLHQIWHQATCPPSRTNGVSVQGPLERIRRGMRSLNLEGIMGIVVVLNTIAVGVSSECWRGWGGWVGIDTAFAAIFLFEASTKCRRTGAWNYFFGHAWMQNVFDFALVVLALVEVVFYFVEFAAQADGGAGNSAFVLSSIRLLRVMRIPRIFRLSRLACFSELLMMLEGAGGGFRTLLWSQVLVALFLFVVALVFREMFDGVDGILGREYFNSLPNSLFTSFRCLIASDCEDAAGRPIVVAMVETQGWLSAAVFCVVCMWTTFGLFNVIVAIFVENTVAAAKHNDKRRKQERLLDKAILHKKLVELVDFIVKSVDAPQRKSVTRSMGCMSYEDVSCLSLTPESFEALRQRPEFCEMLRALDIPDEEQVDLFDILDIDGGGTVDLEELVQVLWKLRGDARRSDVISVGLMVRSLQTAVQSLQNSLSATSTEPSNPHDVI